MHEGLIQLLGQQKFIHEEKVRPQKHTACIDLSQKKKGLKVLYTLDYILEHLNREWKWYLFLRATNYWSVQSDDHPNDQFWKFLE